MREWGFGVFVEGLKLELSYFNRPGIAKTKIDDERSVGRRPASAEQTKMRWLS
jgi:hypothetical protein